METVAYLLDKNTFEILDIVNVIDYEVGQDEETNAKSNIYVIDKSTATNKDFIFVKENNEITYIGIIDDISIEDNGDENQNLKYTIRAKYITNIFDRKVILKNESLISEVGIEDFLLYTIQNEFTESIDTLLNKTFIDIEVLTHTPKNFSVSTEDGIYNFHTFMTNCTQKYDIVYNFDVVDGRLKMIIENINNQEEKLIDCNVSDIKNYDEIYNTNVIAKVTVLCSDKSEYNYYLLSNRTVTEDISDENRTVGDTETVFQECVVKLIGEEEVVDVEATKENARQRALDIFRSNSYKHLIEFDINSNSTLYDVKKWKCGLKINIKNTKNEIIDSYISAITKEKDNPIWRIKTGNIRITLLDKLKQEKLK